MLREVLNITQTSPDTLRRWFSDSYFDLIIWHDRQDGHVAGFQLCYDIRHDEHVLTWREESGFAHNRVDSGEESPARNMTPILVPDGVFDRDPVAEVFAERSQGIDREIREFVQQRLDAYRAPVEPEDSKARTPGAGSADGDPTDDGS